MWSMATESAPPDTAHSTVAPGGIRSCSRMKVSTVFNNGRTSFPELGARRGAPIF